MPRQAPGKQSYRHLPKSTSEILLLTQTIIGAHLHGILHIGSMLLPQQQWSPYTPSLLTPFLGVSLYPLESRTSPHPIHTQNPWFILEKIVVGLACVCLVQVCSRAGGLAGLTQQVTSGLDAPPAGCQFQQGPQPCGLSSPHPCSSWKENRKSQT